MLVPRNRIVTPVTWAFAPGWLTVQEACDLSGHDVATMRRMVRDGAVDAERKGDTWLVEKRSLWEFQQALAEVLHWND